MLMEGETELLELQQSVQNKVGKNSGQPGNVKKLDDKKNNDGLFELMSLPGMKMSEKARKKLSKVMNKKSEQSKKEK